MKHEQVQELFSDYVEGSLAERQRRQVRAHLEDCAACREELKLFESTLASVSQLIRVAPPEGFVSKVEKRIRARSRGRFFASRSLASRLPFEWFSFVIIVMLLIVYLMMLYEEKALQHATEPNGRSPAAAQPPAADLGDGR